MNLVHTVFEPAGEEPYPTLVAIHGLGSNALDLLGLAPYLAGGRFLVLCPQGTIEVPVGPVPGYSWYPTRLDMVRSGVAPDDAGVEEAAREVTKFIELAAKRYPVNTRKLALLGFSQGGMMAYSMGLREPEKYAALAVISTWLPAGFAERLVKSEALERLPVLVQHGRADDLVDIGRGRDSVEMLRSLKVPVQYREYNCGHEITADGLADLSRFLAEKVVSPIITF